VYLGAHYPLDVAAGGVLGVCAGLASRLLVA
jgi:membrane-associated phospholipid phosphatase